MKELMVNFFHNYADIIVFAHILSAVIWIGGMVAIRFAVHYAIQELEQPQIKLGVTLNLLKRFFFIVNFTILILIITAGLMAIGLGFKGTPLYDIVHIKEGLWTVMLIIFIFINMKRAKAQKYFDDLDFKNTKETLVPLAKWMIPLNIFLGLIAIYLGVTLRGF